MITALILSGGTGTRLGADIPKQYIEVEGRPIISYCMETLAKNSRIDSVRIVADEHWHGYICEIVEKYDTFDKFSGFSEPGANRQLSIYNGVRDICAGTEAGCEDYVIIHDAARPMLSDELIERCLNGIEGHDGSMPVLPMKDTVYFSNDGVSVTELLDRSRIFAGQAPEVFNLEKYYKANKELLPDKILSINGSTEPAVIAGMDIAMVVGDEKNYKITTPADLERFIADLKGKE